MHGDIEPSDHRVDAARNDDGYGHGDGRHHSALDNVCADGYGAGRYHRSDGPDEAERDRGVLVQINLSWTASTDAVGVAGYRIYRNGTLIASTSSTSYQNTGLASNTTYW